MIPSFQLIQTFDAPTALPIDAGSELVLLVLEQDVERGERAVTARDILLQVELVRFAQFVARVHLLLENSQIIPNHDDFVKECLEPATAGKLTIPPYPSVQILRPNSIHRKPLMIDDKLQDLGELVGSADS
jgi:hypothetical protein